MRCWKACNVRLPLLASKNCWSTKSTSAVQVTFPKCCQGFHFTLIYFNGLGVEDLLANGSLYVCNCSQRCAHLTCHAPQLMRLTARSTLFSTHSSPQSTLSFFNLHSSLPTRHATLYTPDFTHHTLHATYYTFDYTLFSPHSTLYTLHFTVSYSTLDIREGSQSKNTNFIFSFSAGTFQASGAPHW